MEQLQCFPKMRIAPRRGAIIRSPRPRCYAIQRDHRITAPPGTPPIVILPGFGNASRDYKAPFGNSDVSLVAALRRRGFQSYIVPVERKDWFKVAKMLLSRGFWTGRCDGVGPGYSWYLDRVKETVDVARKSASEDAAIAPLQKVILVGHSAGGWLARAFLGQPCWKDNPEQSTEEDPHEAIAAVVTLGTPQSPPPGGARDVTGGSLTYVSSRWPGAYFKGKAVVYVTAGSRAVRGDSSAPKQTLSGYSYGSYKQVIGEGDGVEGDAVVPLQCALLDGAIHVVYDERVVHSMSKIGSFEEAGDVPWYGSDEVVDSWLEKVLDGLGFGVGLGKEEEEEELSL